MVSCVEIISHLEIGDMAVYPLSVFFLYNAFSSLFVEGNPMYLHHLRMALSVTPYILPISVKGFSLINCNSLSLEGLSEGETLCIRLCFNAHLGHQVDLGEISFPQSLQ